MARTALVPEAVANADRVPSPFAERNFTLALQTENATQAGQKPTAYGLSHFRQHFLGKGFSNESTSIICASWRDSTAKQYAVYLKKWDLFCADNFIDPLAPSEVSVVQFLTELFNKGESYSALNTARSALSAFITDSLGFTIGNSNVIRRFLKGVFQLRPLTPRYD